MHNAVDNSVCAVLTIDTKRSLGCHISPEDDYVCQVRDNQPCDIQVVATPGSNVSQTLRCDDKVEDIELNSSGSRLAAMIKQLISIWKPRDGSCLTTIPYTKDEGIVYGILPKMIM